MTKQAPLAVVKAEFGSKEKLSTQLAASMDVPEGQSREQFQKRLKTLSNEKLLKLKRVEDAFKSRFGGKTEKAISAVIEKRGLKGPAAESFKQEAQAYSRARLLDLVGPERKSAPEARR